MLAITTRYHPTSGRISATVGNRRVYVNVYDADKTWDKRVGIMTNDAWRHLYAARKFVTEKIAFGQRQEVELLGGWTDKGMVWVFADSPDRGQRK